MSAAIVAGMFPLSAAAQNTPVGGADEKTPSSSEFFAWINNTNEGATAAQTEVNLNFFRWLHDTYGMKLDIYAFDAGAIDGAMKYGTLTSPRFRSQFPQGFGALSKQAGAMGTQLGVWLGPDGYGDTDAEAEARSNMLFSLVKDYNFRLFKIDAVCGQLRPSKYEWFDKTFTRIRKVSPNFILLNHRLNLGWAVKHSTTFLLGGNETYIDVFMTNSMTAPHHRAQAIARMAPDKLTRLTEDHGVCLSSCLDYWEDDLVMQAFNRCLILAPEIYANPWLLRDDEYPRLAFLFNLHKDYAPILVNGMQLPDDKYGTGAISRGDASTRFLTLRNLSWQPVKYRIRLDGEVGLSDKHNVKVRLYHPYILDLGSHAYGSEVEVEVLPFRAALVKLTTQPERDAVALSGIPYEIINDRVGNVRELKLLGMPGKSYQVRLEKGHDVLSAIKIDGVAKKALLSGSKATVKFGGTPLKHDYHRLIGEMTSCDVPSDVSSIYYATCFAADNNALEARSLRRSGETAVPQVKAARDAFFGQTLFKTREIWDRNLFDGDPSTAFSIAQRWGDARTNGESMFCLDMGKPQALDKLTIQTLDEYSLSPLKSYEGVWVDVSADLKNWRSINCTVGTSFDVDLKDAGAVRYVRFAPCPLRLSEVTGYKDGQPVDRTEWRASNLFRPYGGRTCSATQTWKKEFVLDEVPEGAYLCVAINGYHGVEGAWAGFKIDGEYVGCPDRAPSFQSNTWEYQNARADRNYTYYLPLTKDMAGKKIEAYVISLDRNVRYVNTDRPEQSQDNGQTIRPMIKPEVWISAYPIPFEKKTLTAECKK